VKNFIPLNWDEYLTYYPQFSCCRNFDEHIANAKMSFELRLEGTPDEWEHAVGVRCSKHDPSYRAAKPGIAWSFM